MQATIFFLEASMFLCPHCQKPIEFSPGSMAPWWNRELGNPRASLGCGTLILIGIIVTVCSGGLRSNIDKMRDEIQRLEKKVDALTEAAKPAVAEAAPIQLP